MDGQEGKRAACPDLEIGAGPTNRTGRRQRCFDKSRNPAGSRRMTGLRGTALGVGGAGASNMPFYQTNPPFLPEMFSVRPYMRIIYEQKSSMKSVGSFWKTNP